MTRLDQGHLHPKLEVPGLTCPGPESNLGLEGQHSRKEPFEQLVNRYSEHLHMNDGTLKNAGDMAPPSACFT
jgi:hypothetical protein